jgi:hypothetical protein
LFGCDELTPEIRMFEHEACDSGLIEGRLDCST